VTDIWHADVPVPDWLRRAAIPALSAAALVVGLRFLHEQFIWPYFEGYRMLADLHCPPEHLGWAAGLLDAACQTLKVHSAADNEKYRFIDLVALPVVAYACVVATWVAGVRSVGWIAGGTAALLTAMSPFLFVVAHAITPASFLPITVAGTLICAECAAKSGVPSVKRTAWLVVTLLGACSVAGLDVRAGVIGVAALVHALWRGARANARAWTATAAAGIALLGAYAPTSDWSAAVVRAGVRALPNDVLGYGFPDTWQQQPYFGDFFGFGVVSLLIAGAWAARSSIVPIAIAAVFGQSALLAVSAWSATSAVSMSYAVVVVSLAVGATTQLLASRSPRALAAVLPALAAAAFIVTYQTLAIFQDFDPTDRNPGQMLAFEPGTVARLYHVRGHADIAQLYSSTDGLWSTASGLDRGSFNEPANAPVVVDHAVVLSEYRTVIYGYAVRSIGGSWSGIATASELWFEPIIGGCVRPMTGTGVRLYDRPVVPFRTPDVGAIVHGPLRVLDIRGAAWLPELHVESHGPAPETGTGWIYVQTLNLWDPNSPSRSDDFAC
jgi:hypothetical protein